MDRGIKVTDDITWVGVNDYDTDLFEAIWPLPRGVSYNAYLIDDEKVALMDTVKAGFTSGLLDTLNRHLGGRPVDYLVINHMEPDHSGAVAILRRMCPDMRIVGNAKTAGFLKEFYGITEGVHEVADGDTLELGRHKLEFHLTPMVHWPETMMTYDRPDKVLFSGDAFGGFGALPGGIFDDEVDTANFMDETLRYFSNIIGKYCRTTQKAIAKLADLDIGIVAPTHGPVWRAEPRRIIELYERWSRQETEPGVVIVYGSMYGNTETMAHAVARELAERGVEKVRVHNVSRTHASFIINDIWRFNGFVFAGPTYNTSLFPLMDDFLRLIVNMPLTDRHVGIVGTQSWSGGGVKAIREYAETAKWNVVEPVVEAKCSPTEDDLDACRQLGANLAEAVTDTSGRSDGRGQ